MHLGHICYDKGAFTASGRANKLFKSELPQKAANIQAVEVSSHNNATPRIQPLDGREAPSGWRVWYTVLNTIQVSLFDSFLFFSIQIIRYSGVIAITKTPL